MSRPAMPASAVYSSPHAARWLPRVFLFAPVALIMLAALYLALWALPLPGGARLLFALAVAVNVGLLALSSWSSLLGAATVLWSKR